MNTAELITHINESDISDSFLHMSKSPIVDKSHLLASSAQSFALGFNAGGRPDGLWLSQGSSWLQKSVELNNKQFPACCNIYSIIVDHGKLLSIDTEEDFQKMDSDFADYWINMDYFEVDFVDKLTSATVTATKKHELDLSKLRKKPGESLYDTLVANNIIFTNAEDARHCVFYRDTMIDIDRFKYKNWAAVAEKYDGIVFGNYSLRAGAKYFWFQSLDVASSCIWNTSCVLSVKLLFHKIENKWEKCE